jgi:glycosyltransferase involved in cell wall biosynthesis
VSFAASPAVSVVVPAYNNAAFIRETVRSVLAQTFTDFELIISDHGSDDGTWALLQGLARDERVTLLRLPRSDRPEHNWEHATRAASGEFIKLVCGDDVLLPTCLETQVAAMRKHPEAVMVAARRDVVTAGGDTALRSWGLPGMIGIMSGRTAVRRAVVSGTNPFGEPACVLLRRRALESVGGWDGRFPYVLDQHTYSKILMDGDFVGLPDVLARFRLSDGQWSKALARMQYAQVIGFHRDLESAYPGVLSRSDLVRGRTRAKLLAYARRLAYVSLSRRLRTPAAPPVARPVRVEALRGAVASE